MPDLKVGYSVYRVSDVPRDKPRNTSNVINTRAPRTTDSNGVVCESLNGKVKALVDDLRHDCQSFACFYL